MIVRYTDKEIQFIKDNYKTKGNTELGKILGRSADGIKHQLQRFGLNRTKEEVTRLRQKPNKGHFKKGSEPHNTKHNGYERITVDGYVEVRVSKGKFVLKHRLVWEKEKGKIPKNMIVVFKDGNPLNIAIENLELITKRDNMIRNQNREKAAKSLKKKWDVYWHLNQLGIKKSWYMTNHLKKKSA